MNIGGKCRQIGGITNSVRLQVAESVTIHQEWILIDDRPLLTCSIKLKCLLRFFTDQVMLATMSSLATHPQGLERHLLGAHGLVTTGLQEAADKGQDTGKCPVCTKVS